MRMIEDMFRFRYRACMPQREEIEDSVPATHPVQGPSMSYCSLHLVLENLAPWDLVACMVSLQ